jgi:hypothetical protein
MGMTKGYMENLSSIVFNCSRYCFSIEQIQEITGLDKERILEILAQRVKNEAGA